MVKRWVQILSTFTISGLKFTVIIQKSNQPQPACTYKTIFASDQNLFCKFFDLLIDWYSRLTLCSLWCYSSVVIFVKIHLNLPEKVFCSINGFYSLFMCNLFLATKRQTDYKINIHTSSLLWMKYYTWTLFIKFVVFRVAFTYYPCGFTVRHTFDSYLKRSYEIATVIFLFQQEFRLFRVYCRHYQSFDRQVQQSCTCT